MASKNPIFKTERNQATAGVKAESSHFRLLLYIIKREGAYVLFTPFLHGCKTPFEDNIRSSLSGFCLETKKKDILQAVAEGICFHFRWILESQCKTIPVHEYIRFAGGLARMPIISQILADITGHPIETIKHPQYVGAIGAAAIAAVGLGKISLEDIPGLVEIEQTFIPNKALQGIYNTAYKKYLSKVHYDRQPAKKWC